MELDGKLDGTWKVEVVSGAKLFKAMNLIGDHKVISGDSGHNLAKGTRWGEFKVSRPCDFIGYILTYRDAPIIDKIWWQTPGSFDALNGNFYLDGNFVGFFTMTRVKSLKSRFRLWFEKIFGKRKET